MLPVVEQVGEKLTEHYTSSAGGSFLPDPCSRYSLIRILTATALCGLLVTLVASELQTFDWRRLGLTCLFILWITLCVALVLCRLQAWLNQRRAALQALCVLLVVICISAAVSSAAETLRLQGLLYLNHSGGEFNRSWVFSVSLISALICLIVLHYLYILQRANREKQAALEARLQALQARIRPHFLFNSMNVIAELIGEDPESAEEAVLDLCDLFRDALSREPGLVPLAEEQDLVQRYLRLESLRLKERLQVQWDMAPECAQILIPSLSLQPLVENAIYHGIALLADPGLLHIQGTLRGRFLEISVRNPRPPGQQESHGHQLALNNLRERLQACYGPAACLYSQAQGDHYTARLRIPSA